MATFTKTAQGALGAISAGASILNAFGVGSTLKTPSPSQNNFNLLREGILADVRKYGIQKANLGYALIKMPNTLSFVSGTERIILLAQNRADRFPIPSVSLATSDIRRYGIGPIEKKPYLPLFTDVSIDFIGDNSGNIHKFFYLWMNSIVNFFELPAENSKKDSFGGTSLVSQSNKSPFTLEYKQNYATNITLRMFSDNQEKTSDIILENAFPITLSEIQYDWGSENQLVRFTVGFTFTHWTYNISDPSFGFQIPQVEKSSANFDFIYNFLIQLYPAAQAIELASRRPQQVQDVLNIVNAGKTGLSPITRYF